jgi:dihydrolipoamide dehydrogenase
VIYTHPEVAGVGWTEAELEQQGIEYRKSLVPMGVAGRFLIESEGGSGAVKALVGAKHGNALGVYAIGDGASEFIVGAAWMIETEMRVADVREIVFPHPTIGEALKEAILAADSPLNRAQRTSAAGAVREDSAASLTPAAGPVR